MCKKNKFRSSLIIVSVFFFSGISYADITGTVFRDYNANGAQDTTEPGAPGIVVNAYGANGVALGNSPQTAGANGAYTLTGLTAASPVRLEFSFPTDGSLAYFKTGSTGAENMTSVVFTIDGTTVDYGVNNPADYCEADPLLTSACYVNGDPLPAGSAAGALDALITWPLSRTGDTTPPDHIGFASEVGSIWGMTWNRDTETIYASSVIRRHSGLGPDGMGAIYQIDMTDPSTPVVSSFLTINNVGLDPRVEDGITLPTDPTAQSTDATAFEAVGKRSLGDMDISDDNSTLYVMNLNTKSLVMVDIETATETGAVAVTDPGCAATSDIQPFAVEYKDGEVYIGVVCSADSTDDVTDLDAYVMVLNDAGTDFDNFFGPINMDYSRTNAFNDAAGLIPWNPWTDVYMTTSTIGFDGSDENSVYPQPILADIEFDSVDGSIILGFSDRQGIQTGALNLAPDGVTEVQTIAAGDILRACPDGLGGLVIENAGTCNGAGSGTTAGDGPGGGEFYDGEFFANHKETAIGGLTHIPGSTDVISTVFDPFAVRSGGVRNFSNIDGSTVSGFQIFGVDAVGTFGKAVGLGDVEVLCGPPPLEIGNRVWCDSGSGVTASDNNGIQDPGETLAPGVTVRLTCGAEFAEIITNALGQYLFTDAVWAADAGTSSDLIPRSSACTVSIDTASASNTAALNTACGLITPTFSNVNSALLNDDIRDSDGVANGSLVEAVVNTSGVNTTGTAGDNDHSIDFGFGALTDLGDNPDPNYPTILASNGAVHTVSAGLFLGACVDTELDGQPNVTATGDDAAVGLSTLGTCAVAGDDEDGVTDLQNLFVNTTTASLDVTSTGACSLDAWVDFNQDGDFGDAGEQIFASEVLTAGLNDDLNFTIPAAALAGGTYARFRCSSAGGLAPTGAAPDGEVEDYPVTILPNLSLGDFVWYDSNQNGLQDIGEPGVNGITVNLYDNATCAGAVFATTPTFNGGTPAADGFYEFSQLLAGPYCVEFTDLPTNYQFTGQNAGADDIDSDADTGTGQVQGINLTADDPTIDAGVFLNGSISGLTWCESSSNANTAYDPGDGDTVLTDIGITLFEDADCSNTVNGAEAASAVNQDTANPAGTYLFDNLPVGPSGVPICYITQVNVADLDLGTCNTGITASTLGPDLDVDNPVSTDNNFGFEQNLSLGDFVWFDTNQNGLQDGGEPGVNGIAVDLFPNATCTGQPIDFTTTNTGGVPAADGFYQFTGLAVGTYCVQFSNLPTNYQFTGQNAGADDIDSDADTGTGQVQGINLTADDPTIDAGVFLNGSIAGLTWCESSTNANTSYDVGDGDAVLPNIGVTLYEDADCSNTVNGSEAVTAVNLDTSNPGGTYLFDNLPVGPVGAAVCYVVEVDENDVDLGACDTGLTPVTQGPDLDTAVPNVTDVNFGFDDNLGLGDFVWFDTNQNGLQDIGEPGVNGITVNLYDNATCTGVATDNTATANGGTPAADGYYFFGDLDPNDYCVEFSNLPTNYQFTGQNAGADDIDSDADTGTGQVQNISLTDVDLTIDAGIFLNGSIAGLTWCESSTNANTSYDAGDGDSVLPNIGVTLYEDADCSNTVNGSEAVTAVNLDTSNPGGTYLFDNLPVGPVGAAVCYVVEVDDTDADLGVCDSAITSTSQGPDLDTTTPDVTDVDFGFDDLLSLGDYVWYDNNQNGQQDSDEPGVNGITVNLYDNATCTAPSVDTTVTASGGTPAVNGYYNFASLDPGAYCVEFIGLPVDYVFTDQNVGGDDAIDSDANQATGQVTNINLTAIDQTIDAGIYASNGQVSGLLYCDDSPENGTQDADEEVAGVMVTLSRDFDCDNSGDEVIGTMVTDGTGSFLFDDLAVALAPAPPNPQVCYVLEYDNDDPLLSDCNRSVTPETQVVTVDTNTPEAPPVTFIVVNGVVVPPMAVPVNSWLALFLMVMGTMFVFWRQRKINQF